MLTLKSKIKGIIGLKSFKAKVRCSIILEAQRFILLGLNAIKLPV